MNLAISAPSTANFLTPAPMERGGSVGTKKYTMIRTGAASAAQILVTSTDGPRVPFAPKTKLGKALWAARQAIIASGEPLVEGRVLMEELAASRR